MSTVSTDVSRPFGEEQDWSCLSWEKGSWLGEARDLHKVTQLLNYMARIQTRVSWLTVLSSFPFAVRDPEEPAGSAELIGPQ